MFLVACQSWQRHDILLVIYTTKQKKEKEDNIVPMLISNSSMFAVMLEQHTVEQLVPMLLFYILLYALEGSRTSARVCVCGGK